MESSCPTKLVAILLVVKNVLYKHSNNYFADSKSALVAVQNFYPNNPIILDILYFVRQVFDKGKSITLTWSPRQVNIWGNKDADKTAKSAVARDNINLKFCPLFGIKILFQKIHL